MTYTADLRPSSWTRVQAIFPHTSIEEIAYVEVGIKTDTISLMEETKRS